MPSLADHQSNDLVKLLLLGDAKSGKTGSLVSLLKAGYFLRILDYDNLLDVLKFYVLEECPDKITNVEYRSLRDKRKTTAAGPILDGPAKAFTDGLKMIDHWKYDQTDLGKPSEWGAEAILIVDSLSRLCDAAYDWADTMVLPGRSGEKDTRAVYGMAQEAVENVLAVLTSPNFRTNVIVICHGTYMELPDKTMKIFPQGVGQKLSPKIPQYFPNYVRYKNLGGKRTIQLTSDAMIDLANTKPFALDKTLPIESGLATLFSELLAQPPASKPKPTQLKRAL